MSTRIVGTAQEWDFSHVLQMGQLDVVSSLKPTIGTGAVVGAGAVVSKDVAPYEIFGGLPPRHIRWRIEKPEADAPQEIAWRDCDHARLKGALADMRALDIQAFVKKQR